MEQTHAFRRAERNGAMPLERDRAAAPGLIRLCRPGRGEVYVAVDAITLILPAGLAELWGGNRARVQLRDGRWFKVGEPPEEILRRIAAARDAAPPARRTADPCLDRS